ncbi:MAG: protein kinase [Ignavibacteriaceae bacterium]
MTGQTILHYKIKEKLGEGGMGEVYKAQDTKLDRFVALKFLPSQLTASEDDKARFIQEAKAASAMNHPNVCTIYSIEEYSGQLFIAMEYIEGKTLKDKKDSLSEKQILEIGIQAAEGLAAAHEKGIVHRDIKPENIMIRKDGIVQIMDFGLAKLRETSGVSRLTKAGMTMGTMGYMSPEQVQGLDVDHRTDIFSLGVVLYELLAGESPFKGMHETAIMYEIVNVNPEPVSSLKPEVNSEIDEIIFECLEKEPSERYQSAAEIARNLRRVKRDSGKSRITRASVINKSQQYKLEVSPNLKNEKSSIRNTKQKMILAMSFLLVAILAAAISWFLHPELVKEVRKFQWSANYDNFIISPDGKKIAYSKDDKIWIRFLDKTDPVEIKNNEYISNVIWSPNSDYIAYFTGVGVTDNHELRKVSVSGVGNVLITQTGSNYFPRFWGLDDSILVTSWDNKGSNTLLKVPSSGGELKPIYGGDSSLSMINGNLSHVLELQDGKSLILSANYLAGKNQIILQTDGQRKILYSTSEGFIDRPLYSNEGYILFTLNSPNGSDLWAIPFNASSLEKTGNIFLVARNANGPSVSKNGILTYNSFGNRDYGEQLVLLSRSGQLLKKFNLSATAIYSPVVSPDGNKIACSIGGDNGDFNIWVYDIIKGTKSQLTYDIPKSIPQSYGPTWSPDGEKIVFANGFGNTDIYEQEINSSAQPKPFIQTDKTESDPFWSVDGRFILFTRQEQSTSGNDIWYLEQDKNGQSKKLMETGSNEVFPVISTDGKFVAFQSDKSGQSEIWVTNFPKADRLWQISFKGGNYPHWVGDEIFFTNQRRNELMVVKVKVGPEFETPKKLFSIDTAGVLLQDVNYLKYTVTNDGKNIVAVKSLTGSAEANFVLVENWSAEFKNKGDVK